MNDQDPRSSDPAWTYHQHGECVGCGTITGQDQDELCEDCYRLECEEDESEGGNEYSDFEQKQGDDRLHWTRDQHIRGET